MPRGDRIQEGNTSLNEEESDEHHNPSNVKEEEEHHNEDGGVSKHRSQKVNHVRASLHGSKNMSLMCEVLN